MRFNIYTAFKVVLAVSFFAMFSCNENDIYILRSTSVKLKDLKLDTTYITIPIDNKQQYLYKISSATLDGKFCGYNIIDNSLDIYSLIEKKYLSKIYLPQIGPNSLKHVLSIYMHNTDSIFVLSRNQIALVDANGIILKNIMINTNRSFFKGNYFTEYDFGNNFAYNSKEKNLLITNVNPNEKNDSKKRFRTPFISEIDLTPPNIPKNLSVEYSKLYFENYYGFMIAPQFTTSTFDNSIVFNFPIEPNIYKYNKISHKTEVFGGNPNLSSMENKYLASPLDVEHSNNDDKKLLHYIENCIYYKVIPDQNFNGFYRIYSTTMNYLTNNEEVNDFSKKKRFLSIFDMNFNLINIVDLNDRNYIVMGAFTTKAGLYIPVAGSKNNLHFKLFKFKNQ